MGSVVRAWGTANGADILFSKEGDVWKADVPFVEDGEYVAEIYAEDAAGNVGYCCTMLFIVFGHEMCAFLVPRGFTATGNTHGYRSCPFEKAFSAALNQMSFSGAAAEKKYQSMIKKGGYTLERIICGRDGH